MNLDRRKFEQGMIAALSALMTAAFATPAIAYLFAVPRSRRKQGWLDAGDISQVPLNAPQELMFRRTRNDGWRVSNQRMTAWVIRKSPTEVIALAPQCTHLGCAYHWAEDQKEFQCPCHTSSFSMDGKVLSGPAPRPLDRYEAKLQGSKLLLGEIRRSDA